MKKITSLLAIALSVILLSCGSDSSSGSASNWSPSSVPLNEYNGMKISEKITAGWNLGNNLDATDGTGVDSETSWGCPKTTKENIKALAASGKPWLSKKAGRGAEGEEGAARRRGGGAPPSAEPSANAQGTRAEGEAKREEGGAKAAGLTLGLHRRRFARICNGHQRGGR